MKEEIMTYGVPHHGRHSLSEDHSQGTCAGQLQVPHVPQFVGITQDGLQSCHVCRAHGDEV